MLRTLRYSPLLVGMAEVLADAVRYVAIVLVVYVILVNLVVDVLNVLLDPRVAEVGHDVINASDGEYAFMEVEFK